MTLPTNDAHLVTLSISEYVVKLFLDNPWPVLYLDAFSTAACNYLKTLGQRTNPAERAAVIYSMDPVYGAIFSSLFLHESFGEQGFLGTGFILLDV